jgi:hypothetical protein
MLRYTLSEIPEVVEREAFEGGKEFRETMGPASGPVRWMAPGTSPFWYNSKLSREPETARKVLPQS